MGHYGGRGTTVATMVHRVFAICKHGCCLLCYKCSYSYIEKGSQLKWENSHFLRPVAGGELFATSNTTLIIYQGATAGASSSKMSTIIIPPVKM